MVAIIRRPMHPMLCQSHPMSRIKRFTSYTCGVRILGLLALHICCGVELRGSPDMLWKLGSLAITLQYKLTQSIAFANAVKAGVANVMCSYNRVNASWACQNPKVLNGLLKTELGFQGFVVSDWGGTHTGVDAANAGLDMTMPGR